MIISNEFLTVGCLKNLGRSIHMIRDVRQEDIIYTAEKLGISYQMLDAFEHGRFDEIDMNFILKLAELYQEKICISLGESHGF